MPKKSKFFFISVLVLTFSLTVVLADLFSSFITVGSFAFLPSQSVKVSGYKIYAISLYKGQTHVQASNQIQDIKLRGGGGYVYFYNSVYHCLASAYENENDAVNVQNSLKEQNLQSQIIEISIKDIIIDTTFSALEKSLLLETLTSFKNSFKTLYDLALSLDTGTKDLIQCKIELKNHQDKIMKLKQDYNDAFKNKVMNELFQIKLKVAEHLTIIESIVELNYSDKVLFSSFLKESYLKIVELNKTLATELST